jgi:hypothetical protein
MPFMGAPPAIYAGYGSIVSPATTTTILAAKDKTRYWLRGITYIAYVVAVGTTPSKVLLRGYTDNYPGSLRVLDQVMIARLGVAYLQDSITTTHDLNLLTTENTSVAALADNMTTEIYLRYNEVQIL